MRTVVLTIGTLVAALAATIPLSASEADWQASCCYCLAAQTNDSTLPRCEAATELTCQIMLPDPDDCESIPVPIGGGPNVTPPGNGGGYGPGGGPCCTTCYCFYNFGVVREITWQEYMAQAAPANGAEIERLAKQAYDYAQRQSVLGKQESAHVFFGAAAELYRDTISRELSKGGGVDYGRQLLKPLNPQPVSLGKSHGTKEALIRISPGIFGDLDPHAVADAVATMNLKPGKLTRLFHDYHSSLSRSVQSWHSVNEMSIARGVLEASVWGSQIGENGPYRSLHFQAMGSALFRLNRFSDAARAYASAWQGGLQSSNVLESYRYSKSLAENRALQMPQELLKKEIDAAPDLDRAALYRLLVEVTQQ